MPRRSKVDTLPKAVKAWLDAVLVDGNFSGYTLIAAELKARGYQLSKSALQRYGQNFEDRLKTLKLVSEQAHAVIAASPDDEGAVSEALMRLTQEKLFTVMLDLQVDPEKPMNLASAAKAVAELARATVTQKKWQAEMRNALAAAAREVDSIVKKGGLSDDAADDIRRRILGIAG